MGRPPLQAASLTGESRGLTLGAACEPKLECEIGVAPDDGMGHAADEPPGVGGDLHDAICGPWIRVFYSRFRKAIAKGSTTGGRIFVCHRARVLVICRGASSSPVAERQARFFRLASASPSTDAGAFTPRTK